MPIGTLGCYKSVAKEQLNDFIKGYIHLHARLKKLYYTRNLADPPFPNYTYFGQIAPGGSNIELKVQQFGSRKYGILIGAVNMKMRSR